MPAPAASGEPASASPAVPTDFTMMMPPGWVRIPVADGSNAMIVALAKERSAIAPVESREEARRALVKLLTESINEARSAGGIDVFLNLDMVGDLPVPASCLVSYVEAQGHLPSVEDLPARLGGPGVALSVVDLPVGRAVRREATRLLENSVVLTELAFWLHVPGRDGFLVLAFSTPSAELAPALLGLFDAMAGTVQWVNR